MPIMDIIRSVPPEIIRAIIGATYVDDDMTISLWKDTLSFLWVCREWRFVAEPIVFSVLLCGNEDYKDSISNYELILQRRQFATVKQIILRDNLDEDEPNHRDAKYPENIYMMIHFAKFFDDDDGKKDMDSLDDVLRGVQLNVYCIYSTGYIDNTTREEFEGYYFSDHFERRDPYDKDELNYKFKDVSTKIVSKLAMQFPNINNLSFKHMKSRGAQMIFANILINHYMKQLVKLECRLNCFSFELNDGRNIQTLILDNYDIYCEQLTELPPNHVKDISLALDRDFGWDLFKLGDQAPISYDNLIRLELFGRDADINESEDVTALDSQAAENPPLVVFPRLQTLVIRRKSLSDASLKHFLQFPVKVLRVDGYAKHVRQLLKYDLDNLDRLILEFDWDYPRDTFQTEYIQLSNKLFAKTGNIPEVHLDLYLGRMVNYLANVEWIHLTHLYVNVDKEVTQIFVAISKMPNLVSLNVFIDSIDAGTLENAIEFHNELKHNCAEPLQSKIKSVIIACFFEEPSIEFIEALQFLKWYFPELNNLTVMRID